MKKSILKYGFLTSLAIASLSSCQKMDRPVLGDYPTDEPIPGILKFYAPLDGNFVEDMKKAIGKGTSTNFIDGVSGKAAEFAGPPSIAIFKSTNDFKNSTSFTLSYWVKMSEPTKPNAHFVFSMPTTSGHWSGAEFFQLYEDKGQTNGGKMATKFMFFDAWLEFVGDNRISGVMDNQWHHWAVTYNETNSTLTIFVDGKKQSKTMTINANGAPLGKANLSKSTKFVIGGPPHAALGTTPDGWMTSHEGGVDQFRMYNKVLTDAEIADLYAKKQ